MDPTEVPTVVDTNPYAAPEAAISEAPPEGVSPARLVLAESTRRACRFHESVFRSLGLFHGLLALATFLLLGWIIVGERMDLKTPLRSLVINGMNYVAFGSVQAVLGHGLFWLRPWGRWGATVPVAFVLAVVTYTAASGLTLIVIYEVGFAVLLAVAALSVALLCLLHSRKGVKVFSNEYREVIALTRHVGIWHGSLVKLSARVLLVLIAAAVLLLVS
jgi:hypothetical protein